MWNQSQNRKVSQKRSYNQNRKIFRFKWARVRIWTVSINLLTVIKSLKFSRHFEIIQRLPSLFCCLSSPSPPSSTVSAPVSEVSQSAPALRSPPPHRPHPQEAPGGQEGEDPLHLRAAGHAREEVQGQELSHHRREGGLCPGPGAHWHPGQDLVPEQARQGEEDCRGRGIHKPNWKVQLSLPWSFTVLLNIHQFYIY